MRLGITGHQKRPSIDWAWVELELDAALARLGAIDYAYSSLATGADQVFGQVALRRGIKLIAIIPLQNYERFFEGESRRVYEQLLQQADVVRLPGDANPEKAFFIAGTYIVDHVDQLIAVWDGKPAQGFGGTADIVSYAKSHKVPVLHVDPGTRTAKSLL
jgi:hypothetical protein